MNPPLLVLLNGLPGSGKSTLARRWAAEHPPAVVVDVDVVRAGLGERPEHQLAAELLHRAGGVEALQDKHSRMVALVRARPGTHVVGTVDGDPDAGYRRLVELLARRPG